MTVIDVEYEQPACSTRHAWARVPVEPSPSDRVLLKEKIARLLKEKNAVMVSHYYVHPDVQDLAEATGGLVSDSLEMARFGRDHGFDAIRTVADFQRAVPLRRYEALHADWKHGPRLTRSTSSKNLNEISMKLRIN